MPTEYNAFTHPRHPGPTLTETVFAPEYMPGTDLTRRHLIYLDSSIWIELAQRAPEARRRCLEAVAAGQHLFPLSYASIAELFDQPAEGPRRQVGELMDAMSLGVSLRPLATLHMMEADAARDSLLTGDLHRPRRSRGLTWIGEYLGSSKLVFPDVPPWNDAAAREEAVIFLRSNPHMKSVLPWLDSLPLEEMRQSHASGVLRYVDELSANIASRAEEVAAKKGAARIEHLILQERVWCINHVVVPRIRDSFLRVVGPERVLETIREFVEAVGEGSYERVKTTMTVMPSISVMCEMYAHRASDRARRVRPQDFFDMLHAQVGVGYADSFVTRDRNLVDLIGRCTRIAPPCGRVHYGIDGLLAALDMPTDGKE